MPPIVIVSGLPAEATKRAANALSGESRVGDIEAVFQQANHDVHEAFEATWDAPEELLDRVGRRDPRVWRRMLRPAKRLRRLVRRTNVDADGPLALVDPCSIATFPVWLELLADARAVIVTTSPTAFADDPGSPWSCGHGGESGRLESWEGRFVLGQSYSAYLSNIVGRLPEPDRVEMMAAQE